MLFRLFAATMIGSVFFMLVKINNAYLVTVPARGGELVEGIIGSPRFVNPVLAISDADKDMTSLIYSGLMRAKADSSLTADVAESYSISPDGKTYTFNIRGDARFHDGEELTAEDVEFTVQKIKDPAIKSPKRANWEGVSIEVINERTIAFRLERAYGPFLENTTIGILPKHIWQDATPDEFTFSEYNIAPIGSGPYRVVGVERSSVGVPNAYKLKAFSKYPQGEPFITHLTLRFYPSEVDLMKALDSGDIESASGLSPSLVTSLGADTRIETSILPRIFAVFFNQNQNAIFSHKEVREALDASIDKEKIISGVLFGYGVVLNGPIPPLSADTDGNREEDKDSNARTEKARGILEDGGWKQDGEGIWQKKFSKETQSLRFTLTTGSAPELKAAANVIVDEWAKLGIPVELAVYETGDLNQNIIRPRKYEALLFGEIIGRDLDLFPFWHSSQRNDPGLNIAMYVNTRADKLLEDARAAAEPDLRRQKYLEFEAEIRDDAPAVFLYSPSFTYVLPKKIENVSLGQLTFPGERFSNISDWYIEKNKVWKIFTNQ
jgi:peptide/nickel transport system substrate-binding protein